jgi:ribosomal 50S subunit-recycling heat shock protein
MRIDVTLKYLCLAKSRSMAKTLCDNRRVLVNGRHVRPAAPVDAGDRITIQYRARTVSVRLVKVPRKQLRKTAVLDYYQPVDTPSSESRPDSRDPLDQDLEVDLDDLTGPR